jgi:hypothetical protein
MYCHRFWVSVTLIVWLCAMISTVSAAAAQASGWRLLPGRSPAEGGGAASMSRTSDMTRSDLDLAGLMLRCRDTGTAMQGADATSPMVQDDDTHGVGAQIAIVVITPFPPRAQPSVTIGAAGKEWHFDARVLPPGVELLLPSKATDLAIGSWQLTPELAVKVSWQERSFKGVIPIDGIADALATMAANCTAN